MQFPLKVKTRCVPGISLPTGSVRDTAIRASCWVNGVGGELGQ
ncbi:hypothetical protein A225_3342 [Klebsiella michiganensis E718]|nr:hypothetical protein A225_3342 [Klebsiella michiganensis E718]